MKLRHKIAIAAVAVAAVATPLLLPHHVATSDAIYPTVSGVTNPNVNQSNVEQTICVSGWTATIRPPASYTTSLKIKQLPASADTTQYEEDHLISLELGGNPTDPNNLWPEPYDTQINGQRVGAHEKDQTENYLKKQVCTGTLTLAEAQKEIVQDWYAVYLKIGTKPTFGSIIEVSDTDE